MWTIWELFLPPLIFCLGEQQTQRRKQNYLRRNSNPVTSHKRLTYFLKLLVTLTDNPCAPFHGHPLPVPGLRAPLHVPPSLPPSPPSIGSDFHACICILPPSIQPAYNLSFNRVTISHFPFYRSSFVGVIFRHDICPKINNARISGQEIYTVKVHHLGHFSLVIKQSKCIIYP